MMTFNNKAVYLCCGHVDMRKSINGLVELVQSSFNLDPFCDDIFAFSNRRRNRIKLLEWDGDGFWLHFKRLERGRIRWPDAGDEATMTLNGEELSVLLSGTKVELKLKRKDVFERNIS